MLNENKYQLTDEEIESGINDFFTQLLIETKRQKTNAKTLEELVSEEPTVEYIVGQPGAGKTSLENYIRGKYIEKSECIVGIGADKIATYHKYYNDLLKLLPDECYTISRQFVRPAQPKILEQLRANSINIIQECSFTKGEKDYRDIQEYRESGYRVNINIIAVDKYESFLSCIERDIDLLKLGYDPRPVARKNHDRMYDSFIQEVIEMNKRGTLDHVRVYIRGKSVIEPILVYENGCDTYSCPQEAIRYERMKSRKSVLREPEKYLDRMKKAKENIGKLIKDEVMKKSYLEGLNYLEKEYINELSFDRNSN